MQVFHTNSVQILEILVNVEKLLAALPMYLRTSCGQMLGKQFKFLVNLSV